MNELTSPRPVRPRAPATAVALPAAATLLVLMNYTAPIITLNEISVALDAGPVGAIWIVSGVNLGLAAALLPAGSLADDHGRRRVFVLGALLLAVSALAGAVATSGAVFAGARVVQGAAGAALLAAGLGILGSSVSGARLARGTSTWGAMLGLGIALGPVAAAACAVLDWRLWYGITALAALVLAAVAHRTLPESRAERRRGLDLPGVLTLSGGAAALLTGVTLGRTGWLRPSVLAVLAVAAVLLAAFVAVELRRRTPMLDPRLFRRPPFLLSILGALVTGLGVIGIMTQLGTALDRMLDIPLLAASLLFTVWSGTSFVVALQLHRLPAHWTPAHVFAGALALSALGELGLLPVTADGAAWWWTVPGLFLAGVGSGVANAMLARLALSSVPPERAAMGSGAANTARYVGASVGIAVMVALTAATGGTAVPLAASTVLCLVGAGLAVVLGRAGVRPAPR